MICVVKNRCKSCKHYFLKHNFPLDCFKFDGYFQGNYGILCFPFNTSETKTSDPEIFKSDRGIITFYSLSMFNSPEPVNYVDNLKNIRKVLKEQ